MYYTLRSGYYFKSIALDCHVVSKSIFECARELVKYRKVSTNINLFAVTVPLYTVAIYILCELIRKSRGNLYLLVIYDIFTKRTITVQNKLITAKSVEHDLVHNWDFNYGPPKTSLTDNGSQFRARFFTNIFRIMRIKMVFTTTYHPQCNGQV